MVSNGSKFALRIVGPWFLDPHYCGFCPCQHSHLASLHDCIPFFRRNTYQYSPTPTPFHAFLLPPSKGAKGKRSSRESAQEDALNYDSTDSFGLPKKKTSKGRAQITAPKPGNTECSSPHTGGPSTTANAAEKRGSQQDGGSLSFLGGRQVQPSTSGGLALDTTLGSLGGDMPLSTASFTAAAGGGRGASTVPPDEVPAVTTGTGIDLDEDFDSPDEVDALLQMTDPSTLMSEPSGAPASATRPVPPLLPQGGSTNPGRRHGANPTHNQLDTPAATPPAASPVSTSKRRSPSPPSSPRKGRSDALKDSRSGQQLPSRPGRGLTYSGSRDGLSYGGTSEEGMGGESRKAEGRGLQDSHSGGVEPRVTNAFAEGTRDNSTHATTRSPTRALMSRASTDGENSRTEEDGINGGVGNEGEETVSRVNGSDPEASASVAGASTIVGDSTSSLGSVGGASDARRQLTSSGPGIATKIGDRVPRRSALAGADKPTSRKPKSRGVTFDDDLVGVDALDILPGSSSDDGEKLGGGTPPTEELVENKGLLQSSLDLVPTKSAIPVEPGADTVAEGNENSGQEPEHRTSEPWSTTVASSGIDRRPSTSITEGLSPAAALLMADSSSEDNNSTIAAGAATTKSRPGSEHPDRSSLEVPSLDLGKREVEKKMEGSARLLGVGPTDGDIGEDETIDDAKLDLALGFTPSAMEGSRKPRRTLPAGRRRRSRRGESSTVEDGEKKQADVSVANTELASMTSTAIPSATTHTAETPTAIFEHKALSAGSKDDAGAGVAGTGEGAGENGSSRSTVAPGVSPSVPAAVCEPTKSSTGATAFGETPVTVTAATKGIGIESTPSSAERVPSVGLPGSESDRALGTRALSDSLGTLGPLDHGPKNGSSNKNRLGCVAASSSSRSENSAESRGVDVSVLASLERQLVLLASEKEVVAAKVARDEQRLQRDADLARDATAAAQARAFESEAALAAARFVKWKALQDRRPSGMKKYSGQGSGLVKVATQEAEGEQDRRRALSIIEGGGTV